MEREQFLMKKRQKSSPIQPKSTENRQKSHLGTPPRRPGDPRTEIDGKWSEKGLEVPLSPSSILGPLGDLGQHLADIFSVFGCPLGGRRDDRPFDRQNVRTRRAQCP